MAWQLTNPVNVGALDIANYDQITLVEMFYHGGNATTEPFISVRVEYGRTVDGKWVAGMKPFDKETSFRIAGQDLVDLITNSTPNQGETTYNAVKRSLYQWLLANNHIAPGSIA